MLEAHQTWRPQRGAQPVLDLRSAEVISQSHPVDPEIFRAGPRFADQFLHYYLHPDANGNQKSQNLITKIRSRQ